MLFSRKAWCAGWAVMLTLSGIAMGQATPAATPTPDAPASAVQSSSAPSAPAPQGKLILGNLPNEPMPASSRNHDNVPVTFRNTVTHTLRDQIPILTSPKNIGSGNNKWFIPLQGAVAVSMLLDRHTMNEVVSTNPDFNQSNINVSNGLVGGMLAMPVVLFGVSAANGNPHAREAGLLTGEALADTFVVEQGVKLILFRERPSVDSGSGRFFIGDAGPNSSFPSAHSAFAWATAAVLAQEYPSRWKQVGLYTLATGVSLTRVLGQEHFPSDVLVGGAVGYLIGHYVYKTHHSKIGTTDYRKLGR